MIRRALFALILIGAAFGGGAAINGPGLAWLQRNFAGASIIVDPGDPSRPRASADAPPRKFPTAKGPPLVVDIAPPSTSEKKDDPRPPTELALADTPWLPESPSTPASALAPLPLAEPNPPVEDDPPVPPLPSDEPPPKSQAPEPAKLPRLDDPTPRKSDPVARLASIERPSASSSSPSLTWAELRRRMKDLGVARYTLEGETDGRVRFRCVIPVAGLKAVSHQFEAEGDDEPQAIDAALKRIALWKATASPED
jgi:hypothetical protein